MRNHRNRLPTNRSPKVTEKQQHSKTPKNRPTYAPPSTPTLPHHRTRAPAGPNLPAPQLHEHTTPGRAIYAGHKPATTQFPYTNM